MQHQSPENSHDVSPELLRRRTVMRAVAAGGAVIAGGALLGACGDDAESGDTAADTTPEPTASGSQPSGDGEPEEVELVATNDVPDGGGVIVTNEQVVVTQPKAGEFACFSSTCTHQGCQVGDVAGGTINCPCHGSQFSIEDGSVVTGPATAPLEKVKIAVQGDSVVRA